MLLYGSLLFSTIAVYANIRNTDKFWYATQWHRKFCYWGEQNLKDEKIVLVINKWKTRKWIQRDRISADHRLKIQISFMKHFNTPISHMLLYSGFITRMFWNNAKLNNNNKNYAVCNATLTFCNFMYYALILILWHINV